MDVKPTMWTKNDARSLSPQRRESSPSPYDFCNNRSDGDDCDSCRQTEHIDPTQKSLLSRVSHKKGGIDSSEVHFRDENNPNSLDPCTSHRNENDIVKIRGIQNAETMTRIMSKKSGLSEDFEGSEEGIGVHNFYSPLYQECLYGSQQPEEPVDIENNHPIWLPPPPEDEEDERDYSMDDDDDDASNLQLCGSSLSRSDNRGRERAASEEQRKTAMHAVIDGYYRALIAQLLSGENDKESWLEIVTALSWQAACLVKPDISQCGMDPVAYVKVKCVATGRRSESCVVKGVVCKKNVTNRRMTSSYKNPRLLLLGGALESQCVSDPLSSIDTILTQEQEHLKKTVARLEAHRPNVLLVEKTVSRFAHECLLEKEISVVLNVKRPLLERIARCTGGQIVPSLAKLGSAVSGRCEKFRVEKYTEEHGSTSQTGKKLSKYLMFFEACPKPLGCTVLLKGANGDELKRIKHVVQLAIFAAYHLALETSFLADEGATLYDFPLSSTLSLALPDTCVKSDRSIATVPGLLASTQAQSHMHNSQKSRDEEQLVAYPAPSSSASDWSKSSSRSSDMANPVPTSPRVFSTTGNFPCPMQCYEFPERPAGSASIEPLATGIENIHTMNTSFIAHDQQMQSVDISQMENRESRNQDDFPPSPSDHQSILVSFSSSFLRKGSVCEIGRLLRIKYYGNSDKPLGGFLRDNLLDPNRRCAICDEPTHAHVHCYTHRLGTLSISVRHQDQVLPGEGEGKIWMWHRCLKCPRSNGVPPVTHRVLMSKAAWGLSFGKFLELSFSSHAAASRAAACGHMLHRDCLRFFGCGSVVACFRYAPSNIYSVCLPPVKLEFNHPELQGWLQNEVNEVTDSGDLCFAEALNNIRQIGEKMASYGSGKVAEARRRIVDLEALLQKEKAGFEDALEKAASINFQASEAVADVLELNRLRLALAVCSTEWDRRLDMLELCLKGQGSGGGADFFLLDDSSLSFSKDAISERIGGGKKEREVAKLKSDPRVSRNACEVKDSHLSHSTSLLDNTHNTPTHSGYPCEETPLDISTTMNSTALLVDSDDEMQAQRSLPDGQFLPTTSEEVVRTGKENLTVEANPHIGENRGSSKGKLAQPSVAPCRAPDDGGNWMLSSFYRTYSRGSMDSLPSSPHKMDSQSSLSRVSSISTGGSAHVLLPLGDNDTVVAIYDDEPTSIIAYALASKQYQARLSDKSVDKERESKGDEEREQVDPLDLEASISHLMKTIEGHYDHGDSAVNGNIDRDEGSFASVQDDTASNLLRILKVMHMKVSFPDGEEGQGKLKYSVTCYYATQFDALRKKCCPNNLEFIRSLCRCKKWGAQGGKSNVFFAKTCDDRFVIKQVTKTELESFLKFAPLYFKYLSEALNTGSHTCLAKILGLFRVSVKNGKGGKDSRMDLMVMENLFYGRHLSCIYDLKGSVRSRYNADTKGQNKVLLDQNLLELMRTNPIFVSNKAKRLLERAVWNDTAFLASVDVMDYSLVVGVDEERRELVLGIIDFVRQYTWDKHLETWVKSSGFLRGPKNATPTVISPKQYKKRFRKAMSGYFLVVPDQWDTAGFTPGPPQDY